MGYFDSIKENTALSAPEKKAAFNKQLDENKRSVYPNLILVMLSALGYTKGELAKRLGVSNAETSKMTTQSFCISPYIVIVAMLPSVIFGSLLGDGTDTPNGISDDAALIQNMTDINSGISMILSEGLTDVLDRIEADFAASSCDGKEINNPFGSDVVFNANAFVSQYCAYSTW